MSKINDLAGVTPDQREAALEQLFSSMPDEVEVQVDLPSKGRFYKDFERVIVKPLLFEDEQRILTSKNKNINVFNEILQKSVEGVNIYDLVPFDKLYLLMKVKEVSYGPDYTFEVACPDCGHNTEVTLDVSQDLLVEYVDDDLKDPRTFMLPKLKREVTVRFPRLREETLLNEIDDALVNLHKFVVALDGNEDPVFISKALKRMHIQDLKSITKEINRNDLGLDPMILFECPACKHQENLQVPLDANFFSVS